MKLLKYSLLLLCKISIAIGLLVIFGNNVSAANNSGFDYPLGIPDGEGYCVEGCYGLAFLDKYDYERDGVKEFHPGEDWNDDNTGNDFGGDSNDKGDPVYAISDGVLKYAKYKNRGWGHLVLIEHTLNDKSKVWSQYAHLASIPDALINKSETIVSRGDIVGYVGDYPAGSKGAYHLHFEIRKVYRKAYEFVLDWPEEEVIEYYVDPSDFIDANRPLDAATLSITGTDHNSTDLSWTKPNIENLTKYELYRSKDEGGTRDPQKRKLVGTFEDIDTLSFKDKGLSPNKKYYYSLFAYNDTGNFSMSEEVSTETTNGYQNITNNKYNQRNPVISGQTVVWHDERRDRNNRIPPYIFFYDLESGEEGNIDVSSEVESPRNPVIYDKKIVFSGISSRRSERGLKQNLYIYNGESGFITPLSEAAGNQYFPDIYENIIVWQDEKIDNGDIYMLDFDDGFTGEVPIISDAGMQTSPKIWEGRVAYVDSVIGGSSKIMLYDITSKSKTVIASGLRYSAITFDDGKITWIADKKINVYDVNNGGTTVLTTEDTFAAITKENKVIYQTDNGDGTTSIHVYDLSTNTDRVVFSEIDGEAQVDYENGILVFDNPGENAKSPSYHDIYMIMVE